MDSTDISMYYKKNVPLLLFFILHMFVTGIKKDPPPNIVCKLSYLVLFYRIHGCPFSIVL